MNVLSLRALVVVALCLSPALARADPPRVPAPSPSAKALMRLANGPRSNVQEAASSELASRVAVREQMASEATKVADRAYIAPDTRDVTAAKYMASGAQHDVAVEQLTRAAKIVSRTYGKQEDLYQSSNLLRVAEQYRRAAEVAHRGATQYHAAAAGYAPYSVELETTAKDAATRLQGKAWRAEAKAAQVEQRAAAIKATRPQKD